MRKRAKGGAEQPEAAAADDAQAAAAPADEGTVDTPEGAATKGDEATEGPLPPRNLDQALDVIDELRAELAEREKALATAADGLLREKAEVENFKMRMRREKAESLKYASESLIRSLLPVVDNLERALSAAAASEGSLGSFVTGVEMVQNQLRDALQQGGVTRIAPRGQAFDPAEHEAVAQVETSDTPAGHVHDEFLAGYRMHDRLLRAAQVSVAKAPTAADTSTGSSAENAAEK